MSHISNLSSLFVAHVIILYCIYIKLLQSHVSNELDFEFNISIKCFKLKFKTNGTDQIRAGNPAALGHGRGLENVTGEQENP